MDKILKEHPGTNVDLDRKVLIEASVQKKKAFIAKNGALATWTRPESTGRSPKDTYVVRNPESEKNIDWDSPNNIPLDPEIFNEVWDFARNVLSEKEELYVSQRVIGADPKYALQVRTVSDNPLTILFTDNMFRPATDPDKSVFKETRFELIVLPDDKLPESVYKGKLRSDMVIAMDFDTKRGVVYGSAYMGSVKKLMFTVMNYLLPEVGVLPLHCSANEGKDGTSAAFLGLSGTGKTTLSGDKNRALLGDDEHGWCDNGIFNFENGCYAKMIDINPEKEPEIYNAVMHEDDYLNHGSIVENALMYPDGRFDFYDDRLTQNSRASYPLIFLENIKESSTSTHPKTIIFLTADANGVIPPVSKLSTKHAMFWYLMGYTSKLAGTETGITEPKSVFSRFFGEPFMPRNPDHYAKMFGQYIEKYNTEVYLINTGWTGGPYGVGKRFDINVTRSIVNAALSGQLKDVDTMEDKYFKLLIPLKCPGVPDDLLYPENTWKDKKEFAERAAKLASEFAAHFDRAYKGKVDPSLEQVCPGK